jgi:DNA-binding response OmpR family regulator
LIYVVDDDLGIRESLCAILRLTAYRVCVFEDGGEALRRMLVEAPSLLITDLEMPNMSGAELVARVRAEASLMTLPVLILSASLDAAPGPTSRMSKPFDVSALLATVDYLLAA